MEIRFKHKLPDIQNAEKNWYDNGVKDIDTGRQAEKGCFIEWRYVEDGAEV